MRHDSPRRPCRLDVEALEDRCVLQASGLGIDTQAFATDHVLVGYRPGYAPAAGLGATALGNDLYKVPLAAGQGLDQALAAYRAQAGVAYAQPDYHVHLAAVPDDPKFNQQWALQNTGQNGGIAGVDVGATKAWDAGAGSGGIVVALIDTGLDYTHPDLAGNVWANPGEIAGNGIDDDHDGLIDDVRGWNYVGNNNNVMDDDGHGTHVAGILGAEGNNHLGVAGVLWNVQIMPLKFLDANGDGDISDAILALNYAVAHGAKIVNNSWAGGDYDPGMQAAIQNAREHGVIFVAAAGNGNDAGVGQNNDVVPSYPGNYGADNVVSVTATDRRDVLAPYANFGKNTVDLAAPGVDILSTLPNGQYGLESGTSMAVPFVSGALALVWEAHPDWTYRQVIDRVLATVHPVAGLANKTISGGRLDLAAAIGKPGDGPHVVDAAALGTATLVNRVRITFDRAIKPGSFTAADVTGFTNPQGKPLKVITVLPVAGGGGKQFDLYFAAQTLPGTYRFSVGPDVLDLAGNPMNQDGDGISGEAADDAFAGSFAVRKVVTATSAVPVKLKDNQTTVVPLKITQDLEITSVTLRLVLLHPYDGDLVIHLRSPTGTDVVLANRVGGTGKNFIQTTFDDTAAKSINLGAAPFVGKFQPDQPLSTLAGENAKGTWELWIEDRSPGDVGTLLAWSLTVTGNPLPAAAGRRG